MSKVFIQESTLTSIGDAIRNKTGNTDLIAPGDMPAMIRGIESGGGGYEPTEADLTYTVGDSLFAYNTNKWLLELYKDKIFINTTSYNSGTNNCFTSSSIESLKGMKIVATYYRGANMDYMFSECYNLKELPTILQAQPVKVSRMFSGCYSLREVPDEFFANFDWSMAESQTSQYNVGAAGMYNNCYSLRKASMIPLEHNKHDFLTTSSYTPYYYAFSYCHSLDEILNVPVGCNNGSTNNRFSDTFTNCNRIKELTFAPYNGTLNWSNQTIDLSEGIGYCPAYNETYILDYNSGITSDKKVTDYNSYKALKDDPDWYTTDAYYSRYNVDSAIRTLQSLPTTTGTGCTIKFKNLQGVERGGRIGGMDESYVAAAAAKGWTVAFVE